MHFNRYIQYCKSDTVFQNSYEEFLIVTFKVENIYFFSEVDIFPLENSQLTCVCMWLCVGMLTGTYMSSLFEWWNKKKWEKILIWKCRTQKYKTK